MEISVAEISYRMFSFIIDVPPKEEPLYNQKKVINAYSYFTVIRPLWQSNRLEFILLKEIPKNRISKILSGNDLPKTRIEAEFFTGRELIELFGKEFEVEFNEWIKRTEPVD